MHACVHETHMLGLSSCMTGQASTRPHTRKISTGRITYSLRCEMASRAHPDPRWLGHGKGIGSHVEPLRSSTHNKNNSNTIFRPHCTVPKSWSTQHAPESRSHRSLLLLRPPVECLLEVLCTLPLCVPTTAAGLGLAKVPDWLL